MSDPNFETVKNLPPSAHCPRYPSLIRVHRDTGKIPGSAPASTPRRIARNRAEKPVDERTLRAHSHGAGLSVWNTARRVIQNQSVLLYLFSV